MASLVVPWMGWVGEVGLRDVGELGTVWLGLGDWEWGGSDCDCGWKKEL